MPKTRQHNEWFRTVSLGGRRSCPTCKCKLEPGESVWTWGEYIRAKWRNIGHFCKACWETEVAGRLRDHTGDCGCTVNLVMYHAIRPDWMTLDATCPVNRPLDPMTLERFKTELIDREHDASRTK